MTQTIRVERLLREAVQTPYSDLVTRSTGRALRTSIQQVLLAAGDSDEPALLDFSEVGLVDFSCADEVVAKLLLDRPGGPCLLLQGLREEQLEAIEHVLAHHDLAVLVHDPLAGGARVVGRASPDLHAAFLELEHHGPATAADLAARMGWPLPQAEEVLATLFRLRLVRASGGRFAAPLSPLTDPQ